MRKSAGGGGGRVGRGATAAGSAAIFDLDSTLWDGSCENFSAAHVVALGEAVDNGSGKSLRCFPAVHGIFAALKRAKVPIA